MMMMMIPPVIRLGMPPTQGYHSKQAFVVLVEKRGWIIAKWDPRYMGVLKDVDTAIPEDWRMIPAENVLCWMPDDGS